MKNLILGTAMLLFGGTVLAQNQNVTDISKTTTTTVRTSDGERQLVKKENVQEVQNVELQNAESNELNKDLKATPVQRTTTTEVTGPDGRTRMVDVDRSSYYTTANGKYRVVLDNTGYSLLSPDNKRAGVLRQTSNNNYIFRGKDKTAFGYFDANGNLVLETYDEKTDKVTVETYTKS
ncbi:MAG TPA: hypothetical protein VGB44_04865 [Flavobacterium sp.]|jgi:hypothetical protein